MLLLLGPTMASSKGQTNAITPRPILLWPQIEAPLVALPEGASIDALSGNRHSYTMRFIAGLGTRVRSDVAAVSLWCCCCGAGDAGEGLPVGAAGVNDSMGAA